MNLKIIPHFFEKSAATVGWRMITEKSVTSGILPFILSIKYLLN
jgi:hypothetical protein